MNIENQVCSFEQSLKLKELGIAQQSLFYWAQMYTGKTPVIQHSNDDFDGWITTVVSAFTFAELGLMLPYSISNKNKEEFTLSATKNYDYFTKIVSYTSGYYSFSTHKWYYSIISSSSALCAAELLISILEGEKTDVSDVNQRLSS